MPFYITGIFIGIKTPCIMKFLTRTILACLLTATLLDSCKKSNPVYDTAPTSVLNVSINFNPQYPIPSLNTVYSYSSSTNAIGGIGKLAYNAFGIATNVPAAYQPANLNYKVSFGIDIPMTLATNPQLQVTTYTLGEYPFSNPGFYTLMSYNDESTGYEYGWGLFGNGSSFNANTPLGTSVTITNIYTKNLSDGKHTYADGSFNATYYGGDVINVQSGTGPKVPGVVQITGSFTAMPVFE
jgi:hypothetical protein